MKRIHRQRLFALARQVESQKPLRRKIGDNFYNIGFSLASWFHEGDQQSDHTCGAVACLAGETVLMFGKREHRDGVLSDCFYPAVEAAKLLGLSVPNYYALFMPQAVALDEPNHIHTSAARAAVTGKQAARVVRHYVKTGKVDWSVRDGAK